jgi:hypothetical protein
MIKKLEIKRIRTEIEIADKKRTDLYFLARRGTKREGKSQSMTNRHTDDMRHSWWKRTRWFIQ